MGRFYKPPVCNLIKATQLFERVNVDFNGPLPCSNKCYYMLTVIDEYSRYPFAFACSHMRSSSVVTCLSQLFAIFGLPVYIHSGHAASFLSSDLVNFLHSKEELHPITLRAAPVRFPVGREDTFSTRDLATTPDSPTDAADHLEDIQTIDHVEMDITPEGNSEVPRRSTRERKPPERLKGRLQTPHS